MDETMPRCPFCRQEVRPGANFCRYCGRNLPLLAPQPHGVAAAPCPHCGAAARSGAKFCPQCGMSLRETVAARTPPLEHSLLGSPAPHAAPGVQRPAAAPGLRAQRRRWLLVTVLIVVALLLGILFFWPGDTQLTPAVPTPNIAATLTANGVTPTAPGDLMPVDK